MLDLGEGPLADGHFRQRPTFRTIAASMDSSVDSSVRGVAAAAAVSYGGLAGLGGGWGGAVRKHVLTNQSSNVAIFDCNLTVCDPSCYRTNNEATTRVGVWRHHQCELLWGSVH